MADDVNIRIVPEYVYLTIPSKYICIYHKLLTYMADYGKTLIDDCNASCKGGSKNLMNTWNLFQSAIACYNLGDVEKADFFIDYIDKQLKLIYDSDGLELEAHTFPAKISEDGHLIATVSCGDEPEFYVDIDTMYLIENHYPTDNIIHKYSIENNNLIVEKT